MTERTRYHPLFEPDVREAALWYDQRSVGLGNAFVELVRGTVEDVIANPQRFGPVSAELRYARVPRFPCVILFDIQPHELLVLGELHTVRSIDKWRERLQQD